MRGQPFTNAELRLMIKHLYNVCTAKDLKNKELAQFARGFDIWKSMISQYGEDRCGGHSDESFQTKYRKWLKTMMHTVKGANPEKVLFIYKYYKTELNDDRRDEIKRNFPQYKVTYNNAGSVLDYEKRENVKPKMQVDDVDEEEEDNAELHVSWDSDVNDEDRQRFSNLSPVLRTPGGTRRDRIDPTATPRVERLLARAVLMHEHFPNENVAITASKRRVVPGAAEAELADLAARNASPSSSPPKKRVKQHPSAAAKVAQSKGASLPVKKTMDGAKHASAALTTKKDTDKQQLEQSNKPLNETSIHMQKKDDKKDADKDDTPPTGSRRRSHRTLSFDDEIDVMEAPPRDTNDNQSDEEDEEDEGEGVEEKRGDNEENEMENPERHVECAPYTAKQLDDILHVHTQTSLERVMADRCTRVMRIMEDSGMTVDTKAMENIADRMIKCMEETMASALLDDEAFRYDSD